MPVSLTEWRVRIGRFIPNPPDSNKQEMIQKYLERWKAKKENTATSIPAAQDQTPCQSAKEEKLKMAASTPSTKDEALCESAKKNKLKTAASLPSTLAQGQTPCLSAKEEKPKMAASPPSTQDQMPCQSATKEKPKMAARPPSTQTRCIPSCTTQTNLVPSSTDTGPFVIMSSITQVLLILLTLMTAYFHWCWQQYSSLITEQHNILKETAQPVKIKFQVFLSMSHFCGLHFCRRMMSNAMGGFFCLYLPLILLMRSGDVETNPGPNTPESNVSEMEFLKLADAIPPSKYTDVGVSLGITYVQLEAILIEKLRNYPSAFMAAFMKWNVKNQPPNGNKREVLADALQGNELGDLSEKLLTGSLLPKSTGGPSRPPVSQTKPLSPELIEWCAKDFKSKYRSTLCKIRADPLNPASLVGFEKLYTKLVLENEDGIGKQTLDYNKLPDLKVNGHFPRRLLVQGEAGAGKTTLCAKIAWDWIEGRHFSNFAWVLIVHLRDAEQYTLGQIAKSYLSRNNPATECQLAEYIRSNPDKVFIAFDGLDEFSSKDISKSDCQQSQAPLQPSQSTADSSEARGSPQTSDIRIVDVLRSAELASCPVFVTSRPWRAVKIRSDKDLTKLYSFIHVKGFSSENLSVYIRKYFAEDDAKANQLIRFTRENDVISENMAHYPIYVAMLCLMWKELNEQKLKEIGSLHTFSQIFTVMICFLKEHYAQKDIEVGHHSFIPFLKEIDVLLKPVAKLAFNGLLRNALTFREDDFQKFPKSKETACRVGILSQENRITSSIDMNARNSHVQLPVFFPHKLFQEYMAGVYLASLYESDCSEFSRLIDEVVLPREKEFRYMLYFTVSQNKNIAQHVIKCMIPKGRPLYLPGVHRLTRIRRLTRTNYRDFIVDVAFESLVAALLKDKNFSEGKLTIDESMTAHTVAGYAFTRLPLVELRVERECGRTMSLDVAEIVCCIPSLRKATLISASFHSNFFEILAQKGQESKIEAFLLHRVRCDTHSSNYLAHALSSMPNLNHLALQEMDLREEFCSAFAAKASSMQIQSLYIWGKYFLSPASSHHLAEALCSMPNLDDLRMDEMHLSDEFYQTLKAKGCFPQVREGKFMFNGILHTDWNSLCVSLEDYMYNRRTSRP